MTRVFGKHVDSQQQRSFEVDSLRGVALLLMVAGHVIGSESSNGMNVPDDSLWRYFYWGLEDVRMPLFAALSGYVYSLRPIRSAQLLPKLLRGKARRLLVPLLSVGTVFFLTQVFVPGTNQKPELSDIWKVYVYGTGHFWFVQAMFLVFIMIGVLDALNALTTGKRWIVALVTAACLNVLVSVPPSYNIFSFTGFLDLLPFFLVGYGMHKFAAAIRFRQVLIASATVFTVSFGCRIVIILTSGWEYDYVNRIVSVCVGLSAIVILVLIRRAIGLGVLSWLGRYSFSIYLLHVFGSAGSRLLLGMVGIESDAVVFGLSYVAAVGLPILFEKTFGRIGWISWTVLGQRSNGARERVRSV